MRIILIALALVASTAVHAKERATFLKGQYATTEQCDKLRKVEAGGPRGVGTTPELLDADGFHGWEGGCEFTKVMEHEPGKVWVGVMICSEGNSFTPEMYVFTKDEKEDSFDVSHAGDEEGAAAYTRCDAEKGNQ
ncbi:MAG TPA: hypothetical protein VEA77_07395 [Hyphomicrobium sp.]|nr:hypothetical protein [Hyphomicrobium sp.]